ncbi:MAG: immunoglobulin domain-containing protein, partial [Phycisphaerae bacterium]
PQSGTICAGAAAVFTVAATGSGTLTYQWQKNRVDLSNGGSYSGVTTPTLTVSGASTADAGSYRCVVGNAYGSATSNEAALTVIPCNPLCLQNLGFEGGFTNGAGNGWTKFIKAGSEGTNLSFSDETTEKHGGAHCQEIYSHDVNNDGGVYQRFSSTPGQPYTIKTWFKVYSPQGTGIAEGFLGIDPYGGTDPNSPNVQWLSKPYEYWSQKPWTGIAQADYITVYLRGRSTKTPEKNKTAYVWIDDIEIAPGAPIDIGPQALGSTSIRWRWADLAIETGYRIRDNTGADLSGLLPADTTQWLETGVLPNTQYTRYIHAVNDCGESDPSVGQTAYSLIEEPQDVLIGAVTPTSIVASPVGTFSNLAVAGSGVLVANTTTGTDSGWQTGTGPWTSSGLCPNTAYDFVARARNGDGVATVDCPPVRVWTLSVPPTAQSIVPDKASARVDEGITWTAVGGFGPGTIQYYRYVWDQNPACTWTNTEPQWSAGTLTTTPTAPGTWYLHVQGCNGEDVANGTYDYAVSASVIAPADLDEDGDVDLSDFGVFQYCFNGPNRAPREAGCSRADFDGDADVDVADFSVLQSCFSGPNQPPRCP